MKVEYKTIALSEISDDLIDSLNRLGRDGWILSTVIVGQAILYREVQ